MSSLNLYMSYFTITSSSSAIVPDIITMSRTQVYLVAALLLVACVTAFRSPVQAGRIAARAVSGNVFFRLNCVHSTIISSLSYLACIRVHYAAPQMTPVDMAVESTNFMSQFSQLVASESDFGGYAGPAGSLIFIGILILTLSPPLADKDQM